MDSTARVCTNAVCSIYSRQVNTEEIFVHSCYSEVYTTSTHVSLLVNPVLGSFNRAETLLEKAHLWVSMILLEEMFHTCVVQERHAAHQYILSTHHIPNYLLAKQALFYTRHPKADVTSAVQ